MKKNELLNLLNQMDKQEDDSSGPHDRVLLIDGLNLFFRNFAMMNFVNEQGVHIGGLGGFIRSLNSLINQVKPTSVYVVFDGTGSSVNRKNLLPEYKSGRNLSRITNWDAFDSLEDEHDSKIDQIVRLIHYLKCLPVKTLSLDKVEADDIIAYLSDILPNKHNSQVFIVSNDKDFVQLVDEKVILFRPGDKEYYTKNLVKEKHKDHVVYSRVVFDMERLENNYRIMDLGNPLMDDIEKEYIEDVVEESTPTLNTQAFLLLYNEDGIGHMIKNPEFTINDTYKVLNSFTK